MNNLETEKTCQMGPLRIVNEAELLEIESELVSLGYIHQDPPGYTNGYKGFHFKRYYWNANRTEMVVLEAVAECGEKYIVETLRRVTK